MMPNDILLSICIPTFNRGAALRETLESIVSQDAFRNGNQVEVVVSDNASTDDTAEVCAEFARRFPGKVIVQRQERNIWTANFHQAMSLGRGQYLKLHNDTLLIREGALAPLLDVIGQLVRARPVMFMTNGNRVKEGSNLLEECRTLDDFIQNVSFFATWMGGFGLWREDLGLAAAFDSDTNHLVQTELVCRQVAQGRPAVVFFGNYFISKQDFRGTYNWTEVFGKNYLGVLKKFVASGQLSPATYAQAKQEVLFRHILPTYFNPKNAYAKTLFFTNLVDYRDDEYFYQAIADRLPQLWRLNNGHNQVELGSVSSPHLLSRVWARFGSRGLLHVMGPRQSLATLDIGLFSTIGEDVRFIVGEVPPPGNTFANRWTQDQPTRAGSIVVGADAWIGSGAQILSGVTIGQGAIVAAGSVVTEDVPPYSRVSGNPACLVSYRFTPDVIEKLIGFDFLTLMPQVTKRLGTALLAPLDESNVDAFLHLLAVASASEDRPAPATVASPTTESPVPAVLILDSAGEAAQVEASLAECAQGRERDLPAIILTTQTGVLPEWTDSLRYVQSSADEFAATAAQLRALPDFEWVKVVELGRPG